MTTKGRAQAYSAGNKVYGFGRSNPTSGPVDPLGYKERDAMAKVKAKKNMMNIPMTQAISRRIQAMPKPAATPAGVQGIKTANPVATATGAYRNAPPPPTSPQSELSSAFGAAMHPGVSAIKSGGVLAPSTIGHASNEAVAPAPTAMRPGGVTAPQTIHSSAPAGYIDPAGPRPDMGANTSAGLALTDAQRNSQQMNNQWAAAHGQPQTYYDQQFNTPMTEINGQMVPNPGYVAPGQNPGAPNQAGNAFAAPGSVDPQTGQPVQQGVNGLGYDPAYAAFLQQQQLQQAKANQALQAATTQAQTAAYGQDRQIDQQGAQQLKQLIDNFSGRGMAFSGAYGTNYGDAQNGIAGAHADNQSGLADILSKLQTGYADQSAGSTADLETALQQYIANLAGSAGSLNLASGAPYQQQAGAGSDTLADLLKRLGVTA